MEQELVKQAAREAENSLREKQVEEVKKIVLKTLEKLDALKRDRESAQDRVKDIDEKIKLLKMDIEDLKDGRLDRMAERQEKDPEAKGVSVIVIIKEKVVEREVSPWYWPYRFYWANPPMPEPATTWCVYTASSSPDVTYTGNTGLLTCSSSKWATAGAYEVNGDIINLR